MLSVATLQKIWEVYFSVRLFLLFSKIYLLSFFFHFLSVYSIYMKFRICMQVCMGLPGYVWVCSGMWVCMGVHRYSQMCVGWIFRIPTGDQSPNTVSAWIGRKCIQKKCHPIWNRTIGDYWIVVTNPKLLKNRPIARNLS